MKIKTNARIAGFMFLFYIATGLTWLAVFDAGTGTGEIGTRLATIADHIPLMRLHVYLTLLMFVNAVVLGVTLYTLTRDVDGDLALMALSCRVGEGVINAIAAVVPVGLIWVATGVSTAESLDSGVANSIGAVLFRSKVWFYYIAATCFAVGSALFCYLFVRARSIPVSLAWLGLMGSVLLVIALPADLTGYLTGVARDLVWMPIAVFEVVVGLWLLIKGVSDPWQLQSKVPSEHNVADRQS